MRRKLKNLKHKSGHSENGSPRQLIDETVYREHWNFINATIGDPHWDPKYSGWSNASRPQDYAIFLRAGIPVGGPIETPIDLGTAGDFAIFAFTGISDAGGSTVAGSMGIDPAAYTFVTGFSLTGTTGDPFFGSAQVSPGEVYTPNNSGATPAEVVQANLDVTTAYNTASAAVITHPPNAFNGHLGGQTLQPGVWSWSGAVDITGGNLTLDGAGVYIFKIAGGLSLAGGHSIILGPGASVANVFWAVAGVVSAGVGSVFNGEVITGPSGSITLLAATVNGRLLSQTLVSLSGTTVTEA